MDDYDYAAMDFLEGRCILGDSEDSAPAEWEELEFCIPYMLRTGPTIEELRELQAAGYRQVTGTKWRRYF